MDNRSQSIIEMEQTEYQKKMDLLGLQEHNLFEIEYSKVVNFTSVLTAKYGRESVLDERSFLLRTITRMTNLMKSVYVIFQTTTDRASMMILTRSIIDLNAIICFLFDFVKDKDERHLRFLLYYLDGVRTRLKISGEPLKERDPSVISEEEYNATQKQMDDAKDADIKAIQDIELRIKASPLSQKMHYSIMENASWRFKRISSKGDYSWTNLYEIAAGERKMAQFEQMFLSHYVHGAAISDFQFSVINETNPVFALNICCSILYHLETIIKNWFPGEYDDLEEAHKHLLVDTLLENMTPESLKEYMKRLENGVES